MSTVGRNSQTKMYDLKCISDYHPESKWNGRSFADPIDQHKLIDYTYIESFHSTCITNFIQLCPNVKLGYFHYYKAILWELCFTIVCFSWLFPLRNLLKWTYLTNEYPNTKNLKEITIHFPKRFCQFLSCQYVRIYFTTC